MLAFGQLSRWVPGILEGEAAFAFVDRQPEEQPGTNANPFPHGVEKKLRHYDNIWTNYLILPYTIYGL
ncbi:MAG TPA: hypothetical protein GXX25_04050 [Desulfotomaculum sp.]|nr:hypothetical protein [Desulfotomaculum sp.]